MSPPKDVEVLPAVLEMQPYLEAGSLQMIKLKRGPFHGPKPDMTRVLIKRGNLDTDMLLGRASCESEGRDWDDAPTSQEMSKIAIKLWKPGEGQETEPSLTTLRRNQSY